MAEEGLQGDTFFGPQLILPNSTLNQIVSLAQSFKLTDIATLAAQTHWRYAFKYGEAIINLVHGIFPLPTETSSQSAASLAGPSDKGSELNQPQAGTENAAGKRHCSKCGAANHIGAQFVYYLTTSRSRYNK